MAIGPKGKVTTTGLMDSSVKIPEAPDMSAMKQPPAQTQAQPPAQTQAQAPKQAAMAQRPQPKDPEIVEKLNALSEEEAQQLSIVLSPSLSNILKKVVPEASDLISQFTSAEENVILPVSVVKNFARKNTLAIQNKNPYKDSLQNYLSHNQMIPIMCHLKMYKHLILMV